IEHSAVDLNTNIKLIWLDDSASWETEIKKCSGLLVGEGLSHIKNKIKAIKYARENNIPFLGISFAFDLVLKEYFTNKLKSDIEIGELKEEIGFTRNLSKLSINNIPLFTGEKKISLLSKSKLYSIYNHTKISERFRRNTNISIDLLNNLSSLKGELLISGVLPLVYQPISLELVKNKFFIAVAYHPEYLSYPGYPNPLINSFIKHAQNYKR
ncbi:MAG: hypothetical protein WCK31_02685, partial [bacterium]